MNLFQVIANVAYIIIEESEEGEASHNRWKEVFILVDLGRWHLKILLCTELRIHCHKILDDYFFLGGQIIQVSDRITDLAALSYKRKHIRRNYRRNIVGPSCTSARNLKYQELI